MIQKILAGNWKMNLGSQKGVDLIKALLTVADGLRSSELWIAPPASILREASEQCQQHSLSIGAQNIHWENSGAFTGEISPEMALDAKCSFVIVGHSERRSYFGETDETTALRMKAGLKAGLKVIACIGETLEERESGETNQVLERQLRPIFAEAETLKRNPLGLLIAYEPVWAIGTGKVASINEIAEAHGFIRELSQKECSTSTVPLLYGGSVKPNNFEEIAQVPHVDGALVGGASLELSSLRQLCEILDLASRESGSTH
jgi:triosephosphate isomerase (TIM)